LASTSRKFDMFWWATRALATARVPAAVSDPASMIAFPLGEAGICS
jgi:hypothetical protein